MINLLNGDCVELLKTLPENSVDSIVTDPPYGLEFMGKDWDAPWKTEGASGGKRTGFGEPDGSKYRQNRGTPNFAVTGNPTCLNCGGDKYRNGERKCRCDRPQFPNQTVVQMQAFQQWCAGWAEECLRVLKPGGYLLAFGGSRTYHRLACAIEDAGFEIRDQIMYVYGSGFPKSLNLDRERGKSICGCDDEKTEPKIECNVRAMSDPNVQTSVDTSQGRGEILQSQMQESGTSITRRQEPPSAEIWSGESGMEGRCDSSEASGELCIGTIRSLSRMGDLDGSERRVCDGASTCNGRVDQTSPDTNGSCTSQESPALGKSARKFGTVAGQLQPQVGGAWPICNRCGLPIVPRGWGTALKPAHEPIVVARKPLDGTVAANVLKWGTGAVNIDGCRVGWPDGKVPEIGKPAWGGPNKKLSAVPDQRGKTVERSEPSQLGRWPANLIHDGSEEVVSCFPESKGQQGDLVNHSADRESPNGIFGKMAPAKDHPARNDSGSAARFFYCAKASRSERGSDNNHPTVKPIALMRYLVRLATPPKGTVLDPFLGSGTTGLAAKEEGFSFVGIEKDESYFKIAEKRLGQTESLLDWVAELESA